MKTMMEQHNEIWNKSLIIIKDNINESAFNTWFKPIVPISYISNVLIIQVPSYYFIEFIEEKYLDILSKSLTRTAGKDVKLEYRVLVDKTYGGETQYPSGGTTMQRDYNYKYEKQAKSPYNINSNLPNIAPQLNRDYTFINFIEGKNNKLALAAGKSIAKEPGNTAFNPCFIYGKSGVGKTHLVNAIGNEIKNINPKTRVLYVTANTFQTQYTTAVINNSQNDFISFYQTIDVLIIDDIHEFSGKTGTQNIYFHIFNHLHQLGKQIIMTCDRPPSELKDVEDRLLTRFKWRLTAEMEEPDFELRKSILISSTKRIGLNIDENILDYIAANVKDNIRDLEGIISSLLIHSTVEDTPIDIELAQVLIRRITPLNPTKITVEIIRNNVCEYFNLSVDDISTKSRKQEVVQARQIAMYLSKNMTNSSLSSIGKIIGNKDHSTVSHSYNKVKDLMETDKNFKKNVEEIEKKLKFV